MYLCVLFYVVDFCGLYGVYFFVVIVICVVIGCRNCVDYWRFGDCFGVVGKLCEFVMVGVG